MDLEIEDPRALELAQQLAEKRQVSIADAVIGALEAELERQAKAESVRKSIKAIADDLWARRGPNGRDMTKEEIDRMWGHD